jgi:glutamate--cysteine ligase
MDLDPFCPIGITHGTLHFLDVYLLNCMLRDSPPDTPDELGAIVRNKQRVAARGREPGLKLTKGSREVTLAEWGSDVLSECAPIAAALDAAGGTHAHREALASAVAALNAPAATPSARVLDAMARDYENSYVRFVLAQSAAHRETILKLPLAPDAGARFARLAQESLAKQRAIETADTLQFDAYLERYLSPASLSV